MSKRNSRSEEQKSLDNEEKQILNKYQEQLATYYVAQKEIVEQEEDFRSKIRDHYKKQADVRKSKYRMAQRVQGRNAFETLEHLKAYGDYFIWLNTDDKVLYLYQRRLITDLQWQMF